MNYEGLNLKANGFTDIQDLINAFDNLETVTHGTVQLVRMSQKPQKPGAVAQEGKVKPISPPGRRQDLNSNWLEGGRPRQQPPQRRDEAERECLAPNDVIRVAELPEGFKDIGDQHEIIIGKEQEKIMGTPQCFF